MASCRNFLRRVAYHLTWRGGALFWGTIFSNFGVWRKGQTISRMGVLGFVIGYTHHCWKVARSITAAHDVVLRADVRMGGGN